MSFEDQLRSDLGGIGMPDAISPPADLADTVLARSRRQTRRRGLAAAGGVVIALAVSGAAAPVLLSQPPGHGPVAPGDQACGGPLPSRTPSSSREYFDPLAYEIDASGVTGYRVKSIITSTYYQGVEMVSADGDRTVGVLLYAAGGEPRYFGATGAVLPFGPRAGEPAGSVGDAPAYWLSADHFPDIGANELGLVWEWAPDAWAVVFAGDVTSGQEPPTADPASTVDQAELRVIVAQIALQLELGGGTPVISPFSMPVPDCTRLAITGLSHETADNGEPYSVFILGFDTAERGDFTFPPASGDYQPSLLVMVDTARAVAEPDPATAYSEDLGYPAYQNGGLLSIYEVSGFAVNVWPLSVPGATTDAEKASLAADVFGTITVYPGAADNPSAWGDPIAS